MSPIKKIAANAYDRTGKGRSAMYELGLLPGAEDHSQ